MMDWLDGYRKRANRLTVPTTLIASPECAEKIKAEIGDIMGVKIVSSSFVEAGRVFLVSKEKLFEPEYNAVMTNAGKVLEDETRYRIAQSLGVPSRYWGTEWVRELPARKPGESLVAWAQRLNLDDPDIRWTYQKGVFAALYRAVTGLVVRVRGQFNKPL